MEYKHIAVKVRLNMTFSSFDLDPMTLILKLDLVMVKLRLCTLNEVPHLSGLEVSQTDRCRHTGRLEWKFYLPTYADGNYNVYRLSIIFRRVVLKMEK